MQRFHLIIGTASLALAFVAAQGQTPSPRPAASSASAAAPTTAKPGKRPLSPEELRDSATMPGELRPAAPVVPQVNIPIGKGAAQPSMAASAVPQNAASAPGQINDAVARCKAQTDPKERAKCMRDPNRVR